MNFYKILFVVVLISVTRCINAAMENAESNLLKTITQEHKEKECPNSADIDPCNCIKGSDHLDLDCSLVQSDEELQRVFMANFPTQSFRTFTIRDTNRITKLVNGIFHALNFEIIELEQLNEFTGVDELALIGSVLTLKKLRVVYTLLNDTTFSFDILDQFQTLERIEFYGNQITKMPKINSLTLKYISFFENQITTIDPDTFNLVPYLENIVLNDNLIDDINPGTFTPLSKLNYLSLYNNRITKLDQGSIILTGGGHVFLNSNSISLMENNAIVGAEELDLSYNNITILTPEDAWIQIFQQGQGEGVINLSNNPLLCHCDLMFLVTSDEYMKKLNPNSSCESGVLLVDLNPDAFIDNCT